ncbi:hypothetical protein TNCV_3235051 [Trichonephila clavipes]|nr:hypothetical protein TNCV_3235051 [Trichonephila clavipes]
MKDIGDGPCHFEPWSSDECETCAAPSPNIGLRCEKVTKATFHYKATRELLGLKLEPPVLTTPPRQREVIEPRQI